MAYNSACRMEIVQIPRRACSRRGGRGFTLLELIIVIMILTLLAGIAVVGISGAFGTGKEVATKNLIQGIASAARSYQLHHGNYPPTSLDELKVKLPNDTNNGIESLVALLCCREEGGGYRPPEEERYTNQDNDRVEKKPTDWYFGDLQLREIQDYWGVPLFYINHVDYAKPRPGHLRIRSTNLPAPVEAKPVKNERTRTWANDGRFQLISAGPDGKFGTEDDLPNW